MTEGRSHDNHETIASPTLFEPHTTSSWKSDSGYVEASIGCRERVTLDVRSDNEWLRVSDLGLTPSGHIPSAVHLVWSDVINHDNLCFKPAAELRTMFHNIGLGQDQEILVYCLGGIWAAWSRAERPIEPEQQSNNRSSMCGTLA